MNWKALTKAERAEYMALQMAPPARHSDYLPDEALECSACGYPHLGNCGDLCLYCYKRWSQLCAKLKGEKPS